MFPLAAPGPNDLFYWRKLRLLLASSPGCPGGSTWRPLVASAACCRLYARLGHWPLVGQGCSAPRALGGAGCHLLSCAHTHAGGALGHQHSPTPGSAQLGPGWACDTCSVTTSALQEQPEPAGPRAPGGEGPGEEVGAGRGLVLSPTLSSGWGTLSWSWGMVPPALSASQRLATSCPHV